MADYFDLGGHSYPVTTNSPEAQTWFDRGLLWTYGYNHEEAVSCFRKAIEADPNCAMAHWGLGYAAGPNYNMPWELFDDAHRAEALATGFAAAQAALERVEGPVDGLTEWEAALVRALPARYPQARSDRGHVAMERSTSPTPCGRPSTRTRTAWRCAPSSPRRC